MNAPGDHVDVPSAGGEVWSAVVHAAASGGDPTGPLAAVWTAAANRLVGGSPQAPTAVDVTVLDTLWNPVADAVREALAGAIDTVHRLEANLNQACLEVHILERHLGGAIDALLDIDSTGDARSTELAHRALTSLLGTF